MISWKVGKWALVVVLLLECNSFPIKHRREIWRYIGFYIVALLLIIAYSEGMYDMPSLIHLLLLAVHYKHVAISALDSFNIILLNTR